MELNDVKWWGIDDLLEEGWIQTPLRYRIRTKDDALLLGRANGLRGEINQNPFVQHEQATLWVFYERGYNDGRSTYRAHVVMEKARDNARRGR